MTRRMACSLTIDAVREQRKTVTRRHVDTWRTLTAGDELVLVERGMGIPKGGRQVLLARVRVTDVRVEPLTDVDADDLLREGITDMGVLAFSCWWAQGHGHGAAWSPEQLAGIRCRRIAWEYLTAPQATCPHPRSVNLRNSLGHVVPGWWVCQACLREWPGPSY